jgi:hypothetical protein
MSIAPRQDGLAFNVFHGEPCIAALIDSTVYQVCNIRMLQAGEDASLAQKALSRLFA